ncbi:hypothetical protein BH10BAC5_BH10BAC5_18480 [soil metagenome]
MKLHKLLAFVLVFSLAVIVKNVVVAQDDDGSMNTEMTMEDWQLQMDEYTAKKSDLTNQLNSLNTDIDGLKKSLSSKDADVAKAESDLYASVGSTKSGVADFRKSFEEVEKIINSKSGKPEDAMAKFNMIKASKIRCLPEFWDRFNAMEKKMMDWMKPGVVVQPSGMYTVVKGDCLWKIAGKKEIYGNSRMWPALWEANKTVTLAPSASKRTPTTIKNPNLIYPGQMLKVPTLTDKMKSDALKLKGYGKWRKNRTMRKKMSSTTTTTDTKKTTTPTDTKKDTKKTTTPTDTKKDMKKTTPPTTPPTTPKK